jgi:hypothetical protein
MFRAILIYKNIPDLSGCFLQSHTECLIVKRFRIFDWGRYRKYGECIKQEAAEANFLLGGFYFYKLTYQFSDHNE